MNIRDHVRNTISDGLAATLTQQEGVAGVIFHDDNQFVPFCELNYNSEYGYYSTLVFSDIERECTNDNPETLHWGKDFTDWKPLIWSDAGGNLALIGGIHQAADLYQALGRLLLYGEHDAEEISEADPSWDYMKRIDWAVREYRDYMGDNRPDEEIANTIRAACRRKAIRGTSQDSKGAWYFRPPAFRGWLVKSRTESRGRPLLQS